MGEGEVLKCNMLLQNSLADGEGQCRGCGEYYADQLDLDFFCL